MQTAEALDWRIQAQGPALVCAEHGKDRLGVGLALDAQGAECVLYAPDPNMFECHVPITTRAERPAALPLGLKHNQLDV